MAQALIEMRHSRYSVLHLAHPRPVPWQAIVTPISESQKLALVSYDEWLGRLRESAEGLKSLDSERAMQQMAVNPALRLLDFFSSVKGGTSKGEAMGMCQMDMTRALEVAPSLSEGELPRLTVKDVLSWMAYW